MAVWNEEQLCVDNFSASWRHTGVGGGGNCGLQFSAIFCYFFTIAFQERVLFLPGGDVERFFSHCGTISKRQHQLDNNVRRLWFMLQSRGDIEGLL